MKILNKNISSFLAHSFKENLINNKHKQFLFFELAIIFNKLIQG